MTIFLILSSVAIGYPMARTLCNALRACGVEL